MIHSVVRYDEQMEEMLDQTYERHVEKKEGSTKQRERLKEKHVKDSELFEVMIFFRRNEKSKLSNVCSQVNAPFFLC